jgi:DNA gyrase inhibitor GyrI
MTDIEVRIERLEPMRVAWVRAVGVRPEEEAWRLLSAWAEPAGLLGDPQPTVFGFNNPAPTRGASEYGYEFWIAVGPGASPPAGIGLKDFAGGLYAVTSCPVGPEMPRRWQALARWVRDSPYAWRRTIHELERLQNPLAPPEQMIVDLCLPVEEQASL